MTDDASVGTAGSSSAASSAAGSVAGSGTGTSRSAIENELNQLRDMGLAKNNRAKYKSSDTETAFLTPEEASAYLANQKTASKKGQVQPTPPNGLSAGDLDSWYMQQKSRDVEARKKREEAEAILRGYRMSATDASGKPRDASSSGGTGMDKPPTGASGDSGGDDDRGSANSRPPIFRDGVLSAQNARGMFQAMDKRTSSGEEGTVTSGRKFGGGGRKSSGVEEEKKADHDDDEKEKEATWNFISKAPESKYTPETDRYHLFLSAACPWSHRTLLVRALKGLDGVVSVTTTHPVWQKTKPDDPSDGHTGWVFADPDGEPLVNNAGIGGPFPSAYSGNTPDNLLNASSVRDIYDQHAKDYDDSGGNKKYTIPILWDKKSGTIVSNESWQIMRMLNASFNDLAENPSLDLYPPGAERNKIDAVTDWIYPTINNGVYRCGFARTQAAYDEAIDELTTSFDRIDGILQKQRFIVAPGDKLTEADVRLFVTLLRFDEVYALYLKCNTRTVASTPAILNYCRDIYQMAGVAETCDMDQIKAHYYCSHVEVNRFSIIPRGGDFMKLLGAKPEGRDSFC